MEESKDFGLLNGSNGDHQTMGKKKRNRKKKNNRKAIERQASVISESDDTNYDDDGGRDLCNYRAVMSSPGMVVEENGVGMDNEGLQFTGVLRQRNVLEDEQQVILENVRGVTGSRNGKMTEMVNGRELESEVSVDSKQLRKSDSDVSENCPNEKSPTQQFMEDMYSGHALRSTVTFGNEKERERVYDTILRLPWRCELLIDVGFFVCLDSFLSVLTIMPMRMAMMLYKSLKKSS